MNNDDNLDLLDLNDDADSADTLPEAAPLAAPRPKKPWLLMAVGVLIIILATYVIIRMVGGDSSSTMEVDLDAPAVIVDGAVPNDTLVVGGAPAQPANVAPAPQPVPQPAAPAPVAKPAPKPQPAPQPAVQNTTPGVPDWAAVTTVEGYNIGFRQFTRRGNGLKYPAEVTTPAQAIAALIKKAAELENGLTLRLKEVRKVESSTRKGKNTYYIFEDTEI